MKAQKNTSLRLGDVANVISGYAFKSTAFKDNGTPVIKIKNIRIGFVDISSVQYVDETYLDIDEKYHVKGGDLLISLTGSHLTQPNSVVGRVALFQPSQGSALLNQRAGKITITHPEICDKQFLFYVLNSKESTRTIALMAHGAASQANVSPSQVESILLNLPPIMTQQKIASILSTYDDLIENNTRRIRILEEMAQSLYREWFIHFRFPGHEKLKLVKSPLGEIPEGWEVKSVAEFGRIITGKTPSKKMPGYYNVAFMPFLKTPDMHGNMFIHLTGEYLSQEGSDSQRSKTLPPNSICVSCIGTVGIVSITSTASQTNQQINSIVLDRLTDREFLFYSLKGLSETIKRYGSSGATMSNLSKGKFESLKIVYPNDDLACLFSNKTITLFDLIKALQLKNIVLRQTRDYLLPNLVNGNVDIVKIL